MSELVEFFDRWSGQTKYMAGQEGTSVLLGRAADALRTNQKDSALAAELLAYSIICENGNYPALALQCQAAAGALT